MLFYVHTFQFGLALHMTIDRVESIRGKPENYANVIIIIIAKDLHNHFNQTMSPYCIFVEVSAQHILCLQSLCLLWNETCEKLFTPP